MSAQSEDEVAGVVCPSCLLSNDPASPFCADCGAPIGMYVTVDPIQRIFAEGFAYRSAVSGPPKTIILVGIWLLFLPALLTGVFILKGNPHILGSLLALISVVLSAGILYRVTANFIQKRRATASAEPGADVGEDGV